MSRFTLSGQSILDSLPLLALHSGYFCPQQAWSRCLDPGFRVKAESLKSTGLFSGSLIPAQGPCSQPRTASHCLTRTQAEAWHLSVGCEQAQAGSCVSCCTQFP